MPNVNCPHCAGQIEQLPALAGQIVSCPYCSKHFQMPSAGRQSLVIPEPPMPPAPYAPQPPPMVFVNTAQAPGTRLQAGGWFMRSFASASGVLLAILAIVGTVTLVACGGCIYVAGMFSNAVSEVQAETEKKNEQRVSITPSPAGSLPDSQLEAPNLSGPVTSPPVAGPKFATRNDTVTVGSIEARIAECAIKPVPLRDIIEGNTVSAEPLLMVRLLLRNVSTNKRVRFTGWPGNSFLSNLSAMDEHGNRYRNITFSFSTQPRDDDAGEPIDPGKTANAVIVLETPIDAANELMIELDGEAIDENGVKLRWKLLREDWTGPA